jgi:glycosyltransferase involved in cell wall biosynthesis
MYHLGDGPVVLYTGVLDEFQRLDLLMGALKLLLPYEPEARLLVAVTIPCEKHLAGLRRQAAELGIGDRLVLTPPLSLAGVRDCLLACDVAVVPRPQAPGFPIKLLNYLAAAKPCVLFASSATDGLVHRKNVYLADPDTSAALAEAILAVLRDPDLAETLGANGYHYVCAHHDRRAVARQLCTVYKRTLELTGRLPPASRHAPAPRRPALPRRFEAPEGKVIRVDTVSEVITHAGT